MEERRGAVSTPLPGILSGASLKQEVTSICRLTSALMPFSRRHEMVQRTLKIILHSELILFYENPLESDYIVLFIEHKHGFLVVHRINSTE